MSDINTTRLPIFFELLSIPSVGDGVNQTLTNGDRWAQHLYSDVSIELICCVLAFVEYSVC